MDSGVLSVEIRRGRKIVRIIRLDDPRERFCDTFNKLNRTGLTAHPVADATSRARAKSLAV
jgi:hypothetical protein